ncbi:MAG: phosphonate lyase system protein PhnH [Rhizobium sp.]|nr:phosphonate lyase system protein PhnH [Rhizobium sp.]
MASDNMIYTGGFETPVFQSQSVFKALMDGMARPGSIQELDAGAAPPSAMGAGAGAIALTLCDHDTPVFLAKPLVEAGLSGWLAFQTGALITEDRTEAQFAFLDTKTLLPPLSTFAAGTQEYPDRSTTIILEVSAFSDGQGFVLSGPGIDGSTSINVDALPAPFEELWRENNGLYPRGIDLVLVAGLKMICLPRTVRIRKGGN